MQTGVYFAALDKFELEDSLRWLSTLGVSAVELSAHAGGRFDVDRMLENSEWKSVASLVRKYSLRISAINMSWDGQLLLGPHGRDTDGVLSGTPAEKRAYAQRRLKASARLASLFEANLVTGFVGCADYSRWFPWPEADGWEQMEDEFATEVAPILDHFQVSGVRFAAEPHPRQFVYNTETAVRSLEILGQHPAWGFNLDPANLMLAGCDPTVFVSELRDRVLNFHAKDAEIVQHNAARSGLLANGPWGRPDRGFRFRVPGWGDVRWRQLISELSVQSYDGPLVIEHEDPILGVREGIRKAVAFLEPLLIQGPESDLV